MIKFEKQLREDDLLPRGPQRQWLTRNHDLDGA